MEYPFADLLDRLSIVMLKKERIGNPESLYEFNILKEAIEEYKFNIDDPLILQLKEINGKIWDKEADIRQEREAELGLEEVGRRSIMIRKLNKIRISIKNEIAKANYTKYNFQEIKKDHGSE